MRELGTFSGGWDAAEPSEMGFLGGDLEMREWHFGFSVSVSV